MATTNSTLNPVMVPSLLYPSFGHLKPKKQHYICPRCSGNLRSRLQVEITRKSETVFGFACDDCHERWYLSSKLLLNEVFEEQVQKIHRFTKVTDKEFGALLVKTPEGIRLDMIDIGENLSVQIRKTKEYREDEEVVGSIHCHPITSEPSDWDIATFLQSDWEKISIVVGNEGSINVMSKCKHTIKVDNVQSWVEENKDLSLVQKAQKYNFIVFRGKVNNLKLLSGVSNLPTTSLEKILAQI